MDPTGIGAWIVCGNMRNDSGKVWRFLWELRWVEMCWLRDLMCLVVRAIG